MKKNRITIEDLEGMNAEELYNTYVEAQTPKVSDMDGPVKGTVLLPPPPHLEKILNKISLNASNPWQGKTFTPVNDIGGSGNNQIKKPGPRGKIIDNYNFKFTLGDAIDGENSVIVLDYNNITNDPNIRFIRDDVKKLNEKLFLGRMYSTTLSGYEPVLYFALQKK